MDQLAASSNLTVSNLVPSWEDSPDGGGSFEPVTAATVVEQALHADGVRQARPVTAPERFDAAEPVDRPSAYSYVTLSDREETWAERRGIAITDVLLDPERDVDGLPVVDYEALRRRDLARELLRARLVAIAEQREHRSAYEIVFILLAASVALLLVAPPLVQVLLAAHGIQG